jgi:hypothetical protein
MSNEQGRITSYECRRTNHNLPLTKSDVKETIG